MKIADLSSRLLMLTCLSIVAPACGDDVTADTDGGTDTEPGTDSTMPTSPTMPTNPTMSTSSETGDPDSTGLDTDTDTDGSTDTETGTTTGDTDTDTGGDLGPVAIWATANPAGRDNDRVVALAPALDGTDTELAVQGEVLSIQSLARDGGDGWASFDGNGDDASGLMFLPDINDIDADGFIGLGAELIRGPAAGLVSPKGVFVGPNAVIVADVGAGNIKGFARDAVEGDGPTFTIDDLGSSTAVWDIHLDTATNTLFAAGTNGEVQIYGDFSNDLGASGPTRTVIPAEDDAQISVNLHGISMVANTLYLSDVGDAMLDDDGQLFVIEDAATATGMVNVTQRIEGNNLGNPVDLEVRVGAVETAIFVAEKANSSVLTFTRALLATTFTSRGSLAVDGAESVTLIPGGVIASRNPADFDGDGVVVISQPLAGGLALEATHTTPDSFSSHQSVHLMDDGSAWVTFDGPASSGGGGVFFVADLPGAGKDALNASEARIWGDATGLVSPKGLDVNADGSLLFVADVGAGDIRVFDGTLGNSAPVFTLDAGDASFWDVAYDEEGDRLYASGTDGVVYVFDDVSTDLGASGPARTITPTDGDAVISINLHGIVYDAQSDTLLLSDVGDASVADDGQIFAITGAAAADGETEVALRIAGAATSLGNPVDIDFDGADLYVAEKSNSAILRYDGILDLAGDLDMAQDATIEVVSAESVQVQGPARR